MARFSGKVGFSRSVETPPDSGKWVDEITEQSYFGDVIRNTKNLQDGEGVNKNIVVNNSISIVANDYAVKNFQFIRYLRWEGVLWTVTSVEVRSPRLILSLGSVYNGPTS
jgi:hypothetical protein